MSDAVTPEEPVPSARALLKERPLAEIKTYLRWHVLHASAPWLGDAFVNENFEFFGKTMRGQKEIEARMKRRQTDNMSQLLEVLSKHEKKMTTVIQIEA